jgi:large subunit ribosomal protein L9
MEIILMEDVPSLGRRGEVRVVKEGYARNYLLPKRLAVAATPANRRNLDLLKRQRERHDSRVREAAEQQARQIEGLTHSVTMRASDDGRLYGSVSSQEVVAFLGGHGIAVEKRRVQLEEPIKGLGTFRVPVKLHPEVTAELAVTITRA